MRDRYQNINWLIMLLSIFVISVIFWSTYLFVKNLKVEERNKMELWSEATIELINIDGEISNLTLEVLKKNKSTPMIKVDDDGQIEINNIKNLNVNDSVKVNTLIKKFSSENEPIEIFLLGEKISTLYYGNSNLLNILKYFPFALVIVASILGFIAFLFFKSIKIAEINMLWNGMAKESAHQIGTPLTSLMGWIELLKTSSNKDQYLKEVEKDLERLNIISERFNKIGSKPELTKENICEEISKTINYLRARLSKKITLEFEHPKDEIIVYLNNQLFSWCLENIIKNSIDSIKDSGKVKISIIEENEYLKIYISDNGIGIKQSFKNKIFKPGATTKKRGWGLGLSLSKRIIEEYHKGEIKLIESIVGQGTKMLIKLKAIK